MENSGFVSVIIQDSSESIASRMNMASTRPVSLA